MRIFDIRIYRLLSCYILLSLSAQLLKADQTSHVYGLYDKTNNKIALINGKAASQPGKIINNATIIIDDGVIVSISNNGAVPSDARVIDLSGHWTYAGFIDPYSDYVFGSEQSFPSWGNPPKYLSDRQGGNAWNDAIHSQVYWVDTFKSNNDEAKPMISNGYTSVQSARIDGIFQGRAATVSLADDIPNNLIYNAAARQFGSFNKGSSKQSYPYSLMGSIALLRQTLSDAKWYESAKGKTDSLITGLPVEYNSALEALGTITQSGMVFHAGDSLSSVRAHSVLSSYDIDTAYVGDGLEYSRLAQLKDMNTMFILPVNFPQMPPLGSFEDQLDASLAFVTNHR